MLILKPFGSFIKSSGRLALASVIAGMVSLGAAFLEVLLQHKANVKRLKEKMDLVDFMLARISVNLKLLLIKGENGNFV